MSFAQRRVQLLAGLVIVAIVAIGAGLSAFYGLTASRQAAAPAITGPAAGTQAKVAIPPQALGFVGSHPGLYESGNAVLSQQQDSAVLGQEQANTKAIQDGAAAIMAEREARADALQQQALTMLDQGNYQRAQDLSKQREAVLRGDNTTSVSSPAPTEREARAEALRKEGDDYLRTGDWQHAQQYYKQSDAVLRGEQPATTPVLTEQARARAEALRKQGDEYQRTGDWMQAQEFYKQSQAIVQGEAK